MAGLFIRLYLDEDVSALVGRLVASRGFEARTTGEAGNLGCSDEEQLAYAASQGMTLLTHNRADFDQLTGFCIALFSTIEHAH